MKSYKALNKQVYKSGKFSIVPIRDEDRYDIMKWRNEQVYHLRQNGLLTKQQQDKYFDTVVAKLFEQERPIQILFSFLKRDVCIGYGGLVHMNWMDKNAEISFIMNTNLEDDYFSEYWTHYLELIENVSFQDLNFKKVYVYAFDLRPHLYDVLIANKYFLDARLKEHCFFQNKFIDVVIHSKLVQG